MKSVVNGSGNFRSSLLFNPNHKLSSCCDLLLQETVKNHDINENEFVKVVPESKLLSDVHFSGGSFSKEHVV